MTIALVIAISGSGAAEADGTSSADSRTRSSGVDVRVTAPEKCKHARKAVVFYRGQYHSHRARLGAGRPASTLGRSTAACSQVRFLAYMWRSRAYIARVATDATLFFRKVRERERRENQHPKWIALRLLKGDRMQWNCLMDIVAHENKRMIPTLDYGGGHGNVYEAYGIPQANPGYKMRSHGSDWRTNPETQLRWMIDYCKGRYGSLCGAAAHRNAHGSY